MNHCISQLSGLLLSGPSPKGLANCQKVTVGGPDMSAGAPGTNGTSVLLLKATRSIKNKVETGTCREDMVLETSLAKSKQSVM